MCEFTMKCLGSFIVLLFHLTWHLSSGSGHYLVTAPNVFHLDQEETVGVATMDSSDTTVTISLHLRLEGDTREWSKIQVPVKPSEPQKVQMRLNTSNLHGWSENNPYVFLVASCEDCQLASSETKVLISKTSHVVFIQLDKPIYTPRQTVYVRVFTFDLDMKPKMIPLEVEIMNPQGVVLMTYNPSNPMHTSGNYTSLGILSLTYKFSDLPPLGNWKVRVRFGEELAKHKEETFKVDEYTPPPFAVTLDCPETISNLLGNPIEITITAVYLHGQAPDESKDNSILPVQGEATIRLGILNEGEVAYSSTKTTVMLSTTSHQTKASVNCKDAAIELGYNSMSDIEGKRLYVEVSVKDNQTGIINTEVQAKSVFTVSDYKLDLSQTPKFFKPGLLFTVKMKSMHPNGDTRPNMELNITGTYEDSGGNWQRLNRHGGGQSQPTIFTGQDGKKEYTFNIPQDAQQVKVLVKKPPASITSNHRFIEEYSETLIVARHTTNSGSQVHIQLQSAVVKPSPTVEALVHFRFATGLQMPTHFYYMIIGRRGILTHRRHQVGDGSAVPLYIDVDAEISPGARLLVYFLQDRPRQSPEMIVDSVWFEVERVCSFSNDVTLTTDETYYLPSKEFTISLQADKRSEMALLAVDKAVYEIQKENSLTNTKVFQQMENLDIGCSPGGGQNSQGVFYGAGLAVVNNVGVGNHERQKEECAKEDHFSRSKRSAGQLEPPTTPKACCDEGIRQANSSQNPVCIQLASSVLGVSTQCKNQIYHCCKKCVANNCTQSDKKNGASDTGFARGNGDDFDDEEWGAPEWYPEDEVFREFKTITRKYFPESFLFETAKVGRQGKKEISRRLPDSLTTWQFQAVAIHKDHGICVAKPHTAKTYKKLFIKINMPPVAVQGEHIPVKATFFNYFNEDKRARGYLAVGPGIDVFDKPNMPVNRYERYNLQTIRQGGTTSYTWLITPTKIGHLNMSIALNTPTRGPTGKDIVEKWFFVKPPGIVKNKTFAIELKPSSRIRRGTDQQDKAKYITYSNPSDEKQQVKVNLTQIRSDLQMKAIANTTVCSLSFQGHELAPILDKFINYEGIESMWTLPKPYHCGEQTLRRVVPPIMAIHYLNHTDRLTDEFRAKGIELIIPGLESQLRYRRNDGSFSFWGSDTSKSTWLTAAVVKAMSFAALDLGVTLKYSKDSTIKAKNVICSAIKWLVAQQKSDGHFEETYIDSNWYLRGARRRLTGGVQDDITVTAFVLMALKETEDLPQTCNENIKSQRESAYNKGIRYLEAKVQNPGLDSPSISNLAVAMMAHCFAIGGHPDRIAAETALLGRMQSNEAQNIKYLPNDSTSYYSTALEVEQTAYALMALLKLQEIDEVEPIVSWLLSKRNSFGAFQSTQDTAVALEALTLYKIEVKEVTTRLQCDVRLQGDSTPLGTYHLDGGLHNLNYERVLSTSEYSHDGMIIETSGHGRAQAYVNLRYYEEPNHTRLVNCPNISLTVTYVAEGSVKDLNNLTICMQSFENTSMGTVEIGLLTGQSVRCKTVEDLANLHLSERPTYTSCTDSQVILYFDKIPIRRQCFTIKTKQEQCMEQQHPAVVSVYDYYEPTNRCDKLYGGDSTADCS